MNRIANYTNRKIKWMRMDTPLVFLLILIFTACSTDGGNASDESLSSDETDIGDTDSTDEETLGKQAFPTTLAVASPLALASSDSVGPSMSINTFNAFSNTENENQYNAVTTEINGILDGDAPEECVFDPELFFRRVNNALCYGPAVRYENHPDAPDIPNSGELPPGDLGIWLETDPVSGDACAAAELNARMTGIQARVQGALSGLASMICTIRNSDGAYSLPNVDVAEVDITNVLVVSQGAVVNNAVLSYDSTSSGEEKFSYVLDFNYEGDHIIIDLVHVPDAGTPVVFRGQLSYRISTMTDFGSNCPPSTEGTAVTRNGSLVYSSAGADNMIIEMREGQFCGSDVNGLDENHVVDATMKFDSATQPNGWGDDFNLLRAAFDPLTQLGDYAYAWQAGHRDGNTRVFNLSVLDDGDDTTEDLSAVAFFGYGSDAENGDPSISGFIFNWAGPGGGDHTLKEYAQRQDIQFNAQSGVFESVDAAIRYAPTQSGTYDGTGSFTYDGDADGAVDTPPDEPISLELVAGTLDDEGSVSIEQTILDAGVAVPTSPVCGECIP